MHVEKRRLALHRQRQFLVAEPLEHVERRQRVGEHRQREIVAAQAEGRIADDRPGDGADERSKRNRDPRGQVEIQHAQRDRVGAETPKTGMAKREVPAVTAQQVPAERQHRPEQHLGQHQLVIRTLQDDERQHQNGEGKAEDRPALAARFRAGSHDRLLMSAR